MRRIRVAAFSTISRMSSIIYVLKLDGGKWYIGRTQDINSRFAAHMSGSGSAWTREYKPISIHHQFEGDNFDEDKTTKQYMSEYGIDNVRGGSYVTINLSKEQRKSIMAELRMADNKCMKCGQLGHFIKNCNIGGCERCGHKSHKIDTCYARVDVEGRVLVKQGKEYICAQCNKVIYHNEGCGCNSAAILNTPLIMDVDSGDDCCFRNTPEDHQKSSCIII